MHVRKFGIAVGLIGAFLYLGCVLLMIVVGKEGTTIFFNSLLHGLDTSSIIRMEISFIEVCIGFLETLVLGWLVGAGIASIYNFQMKRA